MDSLLPALCLEQGAGAVWRLSMPGSYKLSTQYLRSTVTTREPLPTLFQATALVGNRFNLRPLRVVLLSVIEDHTLCTLNDLRQRSG